MNWSQCRTAGRFAMLAAPLGIALSLAACSGLADRLDAVAPQYGALPDHKAMVFHADNDRLVWVSGKDTQLDAIQLAQIMCTRASMNPDDCKLVYVDAHKLYDPLTGDSYAPDSPELADVLYEAGVPTKLPDTAQADDAESGCFLGLFC